LNLEPVNLTQDKRLPLAKYNGAMWYFESILHKASSEDDTFLEAVRVGDLDAVRRIIEPILNETKATADSLIAKFEVSSGDNWTGREYRLMSILPWAARAVKGLGMVQPFSISGKTPPRRQQTMDEFLKDLRTASGYEPIALPSEARKALEKAKPHADEKRYTEYVRKNDIYNAWRDVQDYAQLKSYDVGPVWHGSAARGMTRFDPETVGSEFHQDEKGFFFTNKKTVADSYARNLPTGVPREEPGEVKAVYLKMDSPMIISIDYDPVGDWDERNKSIMELVRESGNDGVIIRSDPRSGGENMYVVFSPNQIKSADTVTYDDKGGIIPLGQRFNPSKSDIRW